MNPSKLTEIVDIYRNFGITNDFGETNDFWQKIFTTRAWVNWDSGSRDLENQEIFHNYSKTIQIWNYNDINDNDRIYWQRHFYRIISIERRERQNVCIIRCELINE